MSSSSSSSSEFQEKQATVELPNFYSGQLLARHVSRFAPHDPLPCCACCGENFKDDEEYLIDTYLQEGQNQIELFGKPQKFSRTKVFMAHARCIGDACTKAVLESTAKVGFSKRKTGEELGTDDTCELVFKKFNWAVSWIAWHHRFLFTEEETVSMTLGSKRPLLTNGLCDSFYLEVFKNNNKWKTIEVPVQLMKLAVLEGLLTRIYEYDLEYGGPYQPILQITNALEKSPINTNVLEADVAVYAHTVLASSFSSSSRAGEQRVKMIVKAKPPQKLLAKLHDSLDSITWYALSRCMQKVNLHPNDSDDSDDELSVQALLGDLLTEIRDCFERLESSMESALESAGVKMDFHVKRTLVSELKITPTKTKQAEITLRSNCYVEPSAKVNRAYYFFREVQHESEQPLYCYEGVLGGVMPIMVTGIHMMMDEMKEASLKVVEMPDLRVLLTHHKKGAAPRAIKQA